MFLFLVAVALVVAASLIFVFTMNWDEDADYPNEALQRKENANKKVFIIFICLVPTGSLAGSAWAIYYDPYPGCG